MESIFNALCFTLCIAFVGLVHGFGTEDKPSMAQSVHGAFDLDLVALVTRLNEEVQRLQTKVSTLVKLETRVEELEKQLKKCSGDDAILGDISETTAEEVDSRSGPVDKAVRSSLLRAATVGCHRHTRQVAEVVAFSAVVSKPLAHLPKGRVIKYDKIILNTGGGYSAGSGIFTAPIPGTYLFLYHIGHHSTGETWVQIVKNGARQNGVAVEGTTGSQNLQGSNSVVLSLTAGDEVWVEVFQVADVSLHELFTTFSGVMLF